MVWPLPDPFDRRLGMRRQDRLHVDLAVVQEAVRRHRPRFPLTRFRDARLRAMEEVLHQRTQAVLEPLIVPACGGVLSGPRCP